jgi:hypothetical protein
VKKAAATRKMHGNIAMRFSKALCVGIFLSLALVCHAEMPGKVDLEAAEVAAGLIDAPVFAIDGAEVGKVTDAIFEGTRRAAQDEDRFASWPRDAQGGVPRGAFMVSRGAVVLELSAEAAENLTEVSDHSDDEG